MSDISNPTNKRFCSTCGAALQPGSAFCGACGVRIDAPAPAPAPAPVYAPPPGYAPRYPAAAPRPAGFPLKWLALGASLVVLIVAVVLIVNGIGGGGVFSSGPTKEDIALNANAFSGSADEVEILRKDKCKLTDLDQSRGYTEKWIIEWRDTDSRYAYTASEAWAFDGYNWDQYFASESKTGCP